MLLIVRGSFRQRHGGCHGLQHIVGLAEKYLQQFGIDAGGGIGCRQRCNHSHRHGRLRRRHGQAQQVGQLARRGFGPECRQARQRCACVFVGHRMIDQVGVAPHLPQCVAQLIAQIVVVAVCQQLLRQHGGLLLVQRQIVFYSRQ